MVIDMRFTKLPGIALAIALLVVSAGTALAQKPPSPSAEVGERVTWHDGERDRSAWVHPDQLAEFGSVDGSVVRSVSGDAVEVKRFGSVRIWRVPSGMGASARLALRTAVPSAQVSPVLYDGPNGTGPIRALPGGVVLRFDEGWSEEDVFTWAAARGLELTRTLRLMSTWYVFATDPGLVALDLAEELRQESGVDTAFPDWWEPRVPR